MYPKNKAGRLMGRAARKLKQIGWAADVKLHPGSGKRHPDRAVLFDTSLGSQNLGDSIIRHYCDLALREILAEKNTSRVPTHSLPTQQQVKAVAEAGVKIVCGTNLITPHFEEFSNWKMPGNLKGYRDIVTLGVGWGYYCGDISPASRFVYRTILSKTGLHSVRDAYTERKFRQMGITNVVNTGCPTLWGLSPEKCAAIPQSKASRVITTLTDYARDPEADRRMIEILKRNYDRVSVWIQGTEDQAYLDELTEPGEVIVIPRELDAYTAGLNSGDVDYAGTRLHAGIHAMNCGVRTIILAVDNRAIEMGSDFNLPVIRREDLAEKLEPMIRGQWKTDVKLPGEQISKWKGQFV